MQTSRFVLTAAMLLGFVRDGVCAAPPDDAATVRAVYAKFVMAMRVGSLADGAEFPSEEPPLIKISDIQTGLISDIAQRSLATLVTKPSGQVLRTRVGDWTRRDLGASYRHATFAKALWQSAPYLTEDWDVPLDHALAMAGIVGYTRYASFDVFLSYQEQGRQYSALFLFGANGNGKTTIFPIDHIIGISTLARLVESPMVPGPLLVQPARSEVKAFISALYGPPGCALDPVTEMCCDSKGDQCGLSPDIVPHSVVEEAGGLLANPSVSSAAIRPHASSDPCATYNTVGPMVTPTPLSDQSDHFAGSHGMSANFQGQCNYQTNGCSCAPTCSVSVQSVNPNESGATKDAVLGFVHVLAEQSSLQTAGPGLNCASAEGLSVSDCFLGICNVQVQIGFQGGNFTISGGNLYNGLLQYSYGPCQTVNF
jgi:hypothetical protein